jgi:hypothetical protein
MCAEAGGLAQRRPNSARLSAPRYLPRHQGRERSFSQFIHHYSFQLLPNRLRGGGGWLHCGKFSRFSEMLETQGYLSLTIPRPITDFFLSVIYFGIVSVCFLQHREKSASGFATSKNAVALIKSIVYKVWNVYLWCNWWHFNISI